MKVNRFCFFSICLLSILLFKALPVYAGEMIPVFIDIKPDSCPNPLNCKAGGFISVAILGTEDLDVADIDPSTVQLEGEFAIRFNLEDVATPFEGEFSEDCLSCNEAGGDGLLDLVLKFDKRDVVEAISGFVDGECLKLTLTGELFDSPGIIGGDIVLIRCKNING